MDAVQDYIFEQDEAQRPLLNFVNHLFSELPGVTSKIRYRVPFYYRKSWICYVNPIKKGGIELCFLRANELSNTSGILDFKDRKQVAGIHIKRIEDIPLEALHEIIQEALLLDDTVAYASKRKKK